MFNLTRQERLVILFLIIAILIGTGINFLAKRYSQAKIIAHLSQDIGKADLNKADKETLMDAPGIGDKTSGRIIEYRRLKGDFKDIEELKNIKGITESRYKSIKEYFYVE